MQTFKEFYEDGETHERIALMPGGYKPPTKGHFGAFLYLLQDADKGVVVIGNKDRDGITAEQSKAIWEIYAKYAGKPVDVVLAPVSPVKSVYDYADDNKEVKIIVGAGDKDEDVKRYAYFEQNPEKYPLVSVVKIPLQAEGISGTKTRSLIANNLDEAIAYFVPEEVSETDKDAIKSILTA
jgi:phosphopantetheine adenylyltransferase